MKQLFIRLAVCATFFLPVTTYAGNYWQQLSAEQAPKSLQIIHPTSFLVYTLDEATLKTQMFLLSGDPSDGMILSLPLPDGTFRDFNVWQTPMMPGELAARYPDIKTFTAEAVGNRSITAKLDFTLFGFHAMIYDGANTSLIDPFDHYHDGFYMVHYKKDETCAPENRMKCQVHSFDEYGPAGESVDMVQKGLPKLEYKTFNGYQLRTYRLALCANDSYCHAATGLPSPTIAQALSCMTTTMNRVNGVNEREISVNMVFVANEDKLIWTTATGSVNGPDPFDAINSNANACLSQNQITCDAVIGNANYDVGHVFTTGAGGLSLVGVICDGPNKAQSVTGRAVPVGDGFDIDYVVHEMGHEFNADHTFNNGSDGSCGNFNVNPPTAFEPGSGSTIMAYGGICDPDNIQPHSDDYYHAISLLEMQEYLSHGGAGCAALSPTNNKLVKYDAFSNTYSIPFLTPFELYAPALTDSVADSATLYCWEQWDTGDAGQRFIDTHTYGPIFRSFRPTASNLRVFPKESMVLAGTLSNAGTNNAEGEKVPDVARTLHFRCTFRDIYHNMGCFTFPDDEIVLHAINTGTGFKVTSQGSAVLLNGHSSQTVTWDVVNTDVAPINASSVDIFVAYDGGYSWNYALGTFPNTGSATVTLPNPAASTGAARIKVKGHGNVFFNVNASNFILAHDPSFPVTPAAVPQVNGLAAEVKIFPVPAANTLHIVPGNADRAVIYNSVGQHIWDGMLSGHAEISVAGWAKGIYFIQLTGENNQRVVKKFVVE